MSFKFVLDTNEHGYETKTIEFYEENDPEQKEGNINLYEGPCMVLREVDAEATLQMEKETKFDIPPFEGFIMKDVGSEIPLTKKQFEFFKRTFGQQSGAILVAQITKENDKN